MNVSAISRSSNVARLLSNEGRVYAVERSNPQLFNTLLRAAQTGTSAELCRSGKATLDAALHNGEVLSPRTAELHRLLCKSVATPALFKSFH